MMNTGVVHGKQFKETLAQGHKPYYLSIIGTDPKCHKTRHEEGIICLSISMDKSFALAVDIHCDKCEKDMKKWLEKIPGVDSVALDAA
ncbi:hypothetical protein RJ639_040449 [Escallonia herrerae]|uniref:HMA domain-containing protein n=1 Tax=Escallonia herrerae TaxID=1293975 RepID=A0AA89B5U5_9ASTE|nr:hypothetical protein RJ639_040449 [Escallonia herrerae]